MNKTESEMILEREIAFQKIEIETQAAELIFIKKDHAIQNIEKQNRSDELFIANKELAFQNIEKQKRADELIIANRELALQKEEKQKRADELVIINEELASQYESKRELAEELTVAYNELKKTEEYLKNYTKGLEEMMFITSHKVRQPIAHILGISNLLDESIDYSPGELKKIVGYIKHSALSLDDFTRELTEFMHKVYRKKRGQ